MKKETVRQLQSLSDDDLRGAVGGMWGTGVPTMRTCLPSCNGC